MKAFYYKFYFILLVDLFKMLTGGSTCGLSEMNLLTVNFQLLKIINIV